MQIGNPDLEMVYNQAIVPAIKSCGLEPKRVDKHNEGGLLKSEIVSFIESSDIIIGDLTNERPNCYLEIGYAMGLDKFRNIILTAREDHNQDSPNYKKGGPKVHFDLGGYDILFWYPDKLNEFKMDLENRIKRRLAIITPNTVSTSHWDEEWIAEHQNLAIAKLTELGKSGFMEIRMSVPDSNLNIPQTELYQVARQSQIRTFGWPIGVFFDNIPEFRPKPKTYGIVAEIVEDMLNRYDYWTIRKDGAFYLLKSLFEDEERNPEFSIFFNTRIVRITETLLYSARLYSGFNVSTDSRILIGIRHGGLKGRIISYAGNRRSLDNKYISEEDQVYSEVETNIGKIESDLVEIVEKFTQPLFVIFDFFGLDKCILSDIVNNYVDGKVT